MREQASKAYNKLGQEHRKRSTRLRLYVRHATCGACACAVISERILTLGVRERSMDPHVHVLFAALVTGDHGHRAPRCHMGSMCMFHIFVASNFKNKTRYTPYMSPGSQISHITTNKGNINRQCLNT